jgi:glucose 1-dehydrogenase
MNDLGLEGKVVIVTGGASGMGRATAIRFARLGAKVMVADRNTADGEGCAREIVQAGGTAAFTHVDIAADASVAAMVKATVQTFGRLDCAFNNAAIHPAHTTIADMDEADWNDTIAVNQSGLFHCLKHELRQMIVQAAGGAIVNTASVAGFQHVPLAPAYTASKAAVVALSRYAAVENGPHNIRVNAIIPGAIDTPLLASRIALDREKYLPFAEALSVLGRIGRPEEIADVVTWLCSDRSSFVTGVALPVDGGSLAR